MCIKVPTKDKEVCNIGALKYSSQPQNRQRAVFFFFFHGVWREAVSGTVEQWHIQV